MSDPYHTPATINHYWVIRYGCIRGQGLYFVALGEGARQVKSRHQWGAKHYEGEDKPSWDPVAAFGVPCRWVRVRAR